MLKKFVFTLIIALPFVILANPINKIIGDESFMAAYHRPPNENDKDVVRIKAHLLYAFQLLSNSNIAHLNAEQAANRKHVLALLATYANAEQYPSNRKYANERKPCFIDEVNGNICAVGYLIEQTEGLETAQQINQEYQYATIEEMNTPVLHQWAKKYGLSIKDCATIQPTYDFKYRQIQEPTIDEFEKKAEEKFKAEMKVKQLIRLWKVLEGKDITIIGRSRTLQGSDSVYHFHIQNLYFSNQMYYVKECIVRYFVKDSVYKYLKTNLGEVSSKKFPTDYEPQGNIGFALDGSTKLTDGFDLEMYSNLRGLFMRLFDSDKHWYWKVPEYDIMQKITEMPKGYTVFIDHQTFKKINKPE